MKIEIPTPKPSERTNLNLLELVCQLCHRNLLFPSEEMHNYYWEARKELESRLSTQSPPDAGKGKEEILSKYDYNALTNHGRPLHVIDYDDALKALDEYAQSLTGRVGAVTDEEIEAQMDVILYEHLKDSPYEADPKYCMRKIIEWMRNKMKGLLPPDSKQE